MNQNNFDILLIDQDLKHANIIGGYITNCFPTASVLTASTGVHGIELATERNPDIVLISLNLPDMDGFTVCKQLKEGPNQLDTSIMILVDEKERKESRIRGLEAGADAFILKPSDEIELTSQINALLKLKQKNRLHSNDKLLLTELVAERTRELERTNKATVKLLEDLKAENKQRRESENKLRESEDRLHRAEIASKSGNWEFNLNDSLTTVSAGHAAIYGNNKLTLTEEESRDMIVPEYRDYVSKMFRSLPLNDTKIDIKFKIKRADNAEILDIHTIATYDRKQKKIFGVIKDITEQKKISEALVHSESLHDAVMSATPDILVVAKTDGYIEKISPTGIAVFGYDSEAQMTNRHIKEFIHQNEWPKLELNFTKLLQGNLTGAREYRAFRKDGTLIYIEVKGGLIKNEKNEVSRIVYMARDISQRKKNELKIKQSETEFRTIWENSSHGLQISDRDGIITRVNKSFCELFDKSENEIVGRDIFSLYANGDHTQMQEDHKRRFANKTVHKQIEIEMMLWNNKKLWLRVENYYLEVDGNELMLVSILTDITRRKNAEAKALNLSRLNSLVAQINQAINRNNEPMELMRRICEVAIEYGQFRLAWFGIYNQAAGSVDIAHSAGYEDGHLASISGELLDINSSNGSRAEAIKNDCIIFSNDIATDSHLLPEYKDNSNEYQSLAIIPLHKNNKTYGLLCLHSGETGFFDLNEQKLIQEIAEDIDYALNAIAAEETRKEAEIALIESENRYNSFINNNVDLIFVKDENRRYLVANKAMAQLYDMDVESLLNKTDEEVNTAEGFSPCRKSDLHALESNEAVFSEEKIGDRYFETTKFKMLLKGDKIGIGGIIHDITHRKAAEEALEKSELLLRTFIDNSPFQIWGRDTKQRGILENKMVITELGSIIGKLPSDIKSLDPKITAKWKKMNEDVLKGKIINTENKYLINNRTIHYHHIIFPIYANKKIIGMAGFNIDISEKINSQQALKESQEQLKNFAAHLQNIREEERLVLAREIHDDLGQTLVAIKIDLGMLGMKAKQYLNPDTASEFMLHFQRLTSQVNETIITARRIMTNLRPEVLDMLGFSDAVKSHLENFKERFSIETVFENSIPNFKIESQHAVALFRIVQESLNNIQKHAYASEVLVSISMISKGWACIEITDNGKGFNTEQKNRVDSYGIIGMKERAFLMDAEFSVESKKNKGTTVRIEIPYKAKRKSSKKS